jgi:hypothetical protein
VPISGEFIGTQKSEPISWQAVPWGLATGETAMTEPWSSVDETARHLSYPLSFDNRMRDNASCCGW